MLVLTESAAEIARTITSGTPSPNGSAHQGLRIAPATPETGEAGALQISPAPQPDEGDQVVEAHGVQIYLEPQAAAFLDNKVLDAQLDSSGLAHFSLGDQDPGQP
jgi:iron-sulfur cluster assembly protein